MADDDVEGILQALRDGFAESNCGNWLRAEPSGQCPARASACPFFEVHDQRDVGIRFQVSPVGIDRQVCDFVECEAGEFIHVDVAKPYKSVTAPKLADSTLAAYLVSTPRVSRTSGARQAARRAASASAGTLSSSVRASASISISSPSSTSARFAASCGFGRNVPDQEAVRAAGEATIGDECDFAVEAAA